MSSCTGRDHDHWIRPAKFFCFNWNADTVHLILNIAFTYMTFCYILDKYSMYYLIPKIGNCLLQSAMSSFGWFSGGKGETLKKKKLAETPRIYEEFSCWQSSIGFFLLIWCLVDNQSFDSNSISLFLVSKLIWDQCSCRSPRFNHVLVKRGFFSNIRLIFFI